MECIFASELNENSTEIDINNDRIRHLKALRILPGDVILFSNGRGLCAECKLLSFNKLNYHFKIIEFYFNQGETPYRIGIAIGILSDKDRMEFALEKAVELGATDFYPLITKFTETKKINLSRLAKKSIVALEQCKRSKLIEIHEPLNILKLGIILRGFDNIILSDENGENPGLTSSLSSTLCLIGPEGGFAPSEIEFIKTFKNVKIWNLGNRRLRTETAAVSVLSHISSKVINQPT